MKGTVVSLGAVLWALAASASEAITIGLDPPAQDVTIGSPLQVALQISGLGDGAAPSLSTFDVDITFDDAVLSFLGATIGDPSLGDQLDVSGFGSVSGVIPGAGVVNLFEVSFDLPSELHALQAGSFILAMLTFGGVSPGLSALDVTVNALGDANGDPLAADVLGGSVTVRSAPVPEPVSLVLVLSGLAGFACATSRRRRRR